MTTNQGNEMASLNDEGSVEDEALTEREDEEVRGSPVDLRNMVVAPHVASPLSAR